MISTFTDWVGTFLKILIKPSTKTFQEEAEKAKGKFISAYLWIIISTLIYFAVGFGTNEIYTDSPILFSIYGLLVTVSFLCFVFFINLFSNKMFKQEYLFEELLYLFVSIIFIGSVLFTPALFTSNLVSSIITTIIIFYNLIMIIYGLKSITEIKVWQASLIILINLTIFLVIQLIILFSLFLTWSQFEALI